MALTTNEQTLFDNAARAGQGFIYIDEPTLVFEAPINNATFNANGIVALGFGTPTTGAITDVKSGMTLELSNGTVRYGSQRVRLDGQSGDIAIYVGRSPKGLRRGELGIDNANTIKIYDEYGVWAKNPYIDPSTGKQYKDEQAYPGDNAAQPPVSNIGSDVLVINTDGSNETIALDADGDIASVAVRSGASISSYSWDIADGTVQTGNVSSSSLTVSFPLGRRYVHCTVTDSNGITHTARKLVVVATPDDCIPATISTYSVTRIGTQLELTIDSADLPTTIREQAKILFVEHATLGDYGNEYIRFSGWLGSHTYTHKTPRINKTEIVIPAHDVGALLARLFAFPFEVSRESGTSDWFLLPDVNADTIIHWLWHWHTTALEVTDFKPSGVGATYPLTRFTSTGATFLDQAQRLALSIRHELTINRAGAIQIIGDPVSLPNASDATAFGLPVSRTTTERVSIDSSDFGEFEFVAQVPQRYYWYYANGIVASEIANELTAVQSIAPGTVPSQGGSTTSDPDQLVVSQDELNVCTGHRYATRGNPYRQDLSLTMVKTWDVLEVADLLPVRVTLPADARSRYNLSGSGDLYLPREVQVSYDTRRGIKEVAWILEPIIEGIPAKTFVEDPDQAAQLPDWDEGVVIIDNPNEAQDPRTGLVAGGSNVLAIFRNGRIAVTTDFTTPESEGGPTWTTYNHSPTLGLTILQFVYDPRTGGTPSGWFVTPTKIIFGDNLNSATPTFTTQHTFASSANARTMAVSWQNAPGLFAAVLSNYYTSGTPNTVEFKWMTTEDAGATWGAETSIASPTDDTPNQDDMLPGLVIFPNTPGRAMWSSHELQSAYLSSGTPVAGMLEYTTDYFDNDDTTTSGTNDLFDGWPFYHGLIVGRATENIAYTGGSDDGGGAVTLSGVDRVEARLGRLVLQELPNGVFLPNGSFLEAPPITRIDSSKDISPAYDGDDYGANYDAHHPIAVNPINSNQVCVCAAHYGSSNDTKYAVFITRDASPDAPDWIQLVAESNADDYRSALWVSNGAELYLFGDNDKLVYTDDPFNPDALDDRSGNLSTSARIIFVTGY